MAAFIAKMVVGRRPFSNRGLSMKHLLLVVASTFALAGAAIAADFPTKEPPPPAPVVGKAPIGKAPIGKGPIYTRG
jgi:hypothetical protein